MPFIYIDRRKAGRGKSSPNRQKLIRRVKSFIKTSLPQNIGQGGVTGSNATNSSPVTITTGALEEPFFCYARDGERTIVLIGNNEYDRDDIIEIPEEDSTSGAGPGEHGEDEFVVNVARDEFLKAYFEDCELPNLSNEKYTEKLDNKFQRAGFSTTGTPAQRSIIRSYKNMIGRRRALTIPYLEEIEALEKELSDIDEKLKKLPKLDKKGVLSLRKAEIEVILSELHTRIAALQGFDDIDIRFHKREAKPLKTVDAVLFMLMDISGSMTEEKKKIARRWFALLYAFIQRKHANTELVFIAHHDEAIEMSEDDFFTTRINGGTTVSPAIEMINRIIRERYDPNQTNIYVSHASDGDNWETDSNLVVEEMTSLMQKIRYFSYVEVGKPMRYGWVGGSDTKTDTELWKAYDTIRDKHTNRISLAIIESADDCYTVFKKVFKKTSK